MQPQCFVTGTVCLLNTDARSRSQRLWLCSLDVPCGLQLQDRRTVALQLACVAQGRWLLRTLTCRLSYHLLEQLKPVKVQVALFVRGFSMWQVEAISPFLMEVFYLCEEEEGQRNIHKHFWDPLSQGTSSCESNSLHS